MLFVPKDLVTIQVGCLLACVYPKIEPSMPVFEHAHAFQVAKSALKALSVDTRLIFEAMGSPLISSTIVDGMMHDWRGLIDSVWFNFNNLTIILFHDLAGAGINNTTIAGNPALLLPVQHGAIKLCRQQDVCFVRITCTIDFTGLVTMPVYRPTTLHVCFYLELPQTTVAMLNRNNAAKNLTAWHCTADLSILTNEDVCMQILEPCLQDGPIAVRPANFNLGNANIDTSAICKTIHAKI
jgi:hypothetical protein